MRQVHRDPGIHGQTHSAPLGDASGWRNKGTFGSWNASSSLLLCEASAPAMVSGARTKNREGWPGRAGARGRGAVFGKPRAPRTTLFSWCDAWYLHHVLCFCFARFVWFAWLLHDLSMIFAVLYFCTIFRNVCAMFAICLNDFVHNFCRCFLQGFILFSLCFFCKMVCVAAFSLFFFVATCLMQKCMYRGKTLDVENVEQFCQVKWHLRWRSAGVPSSEVQFYLVKPVKHINICGASLSECSHVSPFARLPSKSA